MKLDRIGDGVVVLERIRRESEMERPVMLVTV